MSLEERNKVFEKKLEHNPIDQSIVALVKDADRRKWQIRGLAISLLIDVFLTVGLAALALQARDTAISVQKSKDSIIAACNAGNEFKATEAALWNHILTIQPIQNNLTPDQEAQREKTIADFKDYLKTTFAQRDCNNIIK